MGWRGGVGVKVEAPSLEELTEAACHAPQAAAKLHPGAHAKHINGIEYTTRTMQGYSALGVPSVVQAVHRPAPAVASKVSAEVGSPQQMENCRATS